MKYIYLLLLNFIGLFALGQNHWQQKVSYNMNIDMDVKTYIYKGTQTLKYTNRSPDTLTHVFYHLYPNAFQPGSEMDVRLQNIADPDGRMVYNAGSEEEPDLKSRIAELLPNEIGYIKVFSLKQKGKKLKYNIEGTIMDVALEKPLLPGATTRFRMKFEGQVPVQIRRSGRNNSDEVALSMSQWYPKMAEYDYQGWHLDPYIAREFFGVWGDFDVKITIDGKYILGGSGYLQNPNQVGFGYQDKEIKVKKRRKNKTWHFVAPNVHDFTWAADPKYHHDSFTKEGVKFHFLYKGDKTVVENWKKIQAVMPEVLSFFNKEIGKYPWKQYSFIQGGDGGMEYAMCTLIRGGENYKSLEGTAIHEFAHAWFQHALASNESLHAWMDEGFTSYISSKVKNWLYQKNQRNPYKYAYKSYYQLQNLGLQEPETTHSDRYAYNRSYSVNAYLKGQIFLSQLGYILGKKTLVKVLRRYYQDFKMKHPYPNDIIRTAEKVSGLQLHWYLNEWIETTHTIDYAISDVVSENEQTKIYLKRIGRMPMPLDILVTLKDGSKWLYNIPLRMMHGHKVDFDLGVKPIILDNWAWAYPNYEFIIDQKLSDIKSIEIDPDGLMADIDKSNNIYPAN